MKSNKGFSLVELIIVIAIMAILVGVIAPQLIKYMEKTNVASDTQLCDTVHSAILAALSDPDINASTDVYTQVYLSLFMKPNYDAKIIATASGYQNCDFAKAVAETVGFNPFAESGSKYMKSSPAKYSGNLKFKVNSTGSQFYIYIEHSDSTGKKKDNTTIGSSDVICAPNYK